MLFLTCHSAYPQVYFDFKANAVYDNNINDNYEKLEDIYSTFDATVGYNAALNRTDFDVYYNGTFNIYKKYSDKFKNEHSVGASVYNKLNKKRSTGIGFNGNFTVSLNRDEYSYLDYYALSGITGLDVSLSKRWNLSTIYTIDYVNLKEYKIMNNLEHNIMFKLAGYLPWKNSLVVSGGFGYKMYFSNQSGSGEDRVRRGGSSISAGTSPENLMIGYGGLVYTQTFLKTTGIRFRISGHKTFVSENLYVNEYINQSSIFEDEFSTNEFLGEVTITQLLPAGFSLKSDFTYIYDYFPGRPAYDINMNITSSNRTDKFFSAGISALKNFGLMNIGLSYYYNSNNSNDSYFNYTKNSVSLWLSAIF
jgi:hypothetical protein